MFSNIYFGKKVLVTGHTGFKGSWLTCWLLKLGAEVVGVSKDVPTKPAMFEDLQLESMVKHHVCDIRDLDRLSNIINVERPDVIFHLAAQAIVSTSYELVNFIAHHVSKASPVFGSSPEFRMLPGEGGHGNMIGRIASHHVSGP